MTKKRKQNAAKLCSLCGRSGVENVRREMLYKGIWIENLPVEHCPHCHEDVCDWETVQLMEAIANDPEKYAEMVKRPVARVA